MDGFSSVNFVPVLIIGAVVSRRLGRAARANWLCIISGNSLDGTVV